MGAAAAGWDASGFSSCVSPLSSFASTAAEAAASAAEGPPGFFLAGDGVGARSARCFGALGPSPTASWKMLPGREPALSAVPALRGVAGWRPPETNDWRPALSPALLPGEGLGRACCRGDSGVLPPGMRRRLSRDASVWREVSEEPALSSESPFACLTAALPSAVPLGAACWLGGAASFPAAAAGLAFGGRPRFLGGAGSAAGSGRGFGGRPRFRFGTGATTGSSSAAAAAAEAAPDAGVGAAASSGSALVRRRHLLGLFAAGCTTACRSAIRGHALRGGLSRHPPQLLQMRMQCRSSGCLRCGCTLQASKPSSGACCGATSCELGSKPATACIIHRRRFRRLPSYNRSFLAPCCEFQALLQGPTTRQPKRSVCERATWNGPHI